MLHNKGECLNSLNIFSSKDMPQVGRKNEVDSKLKICVKHEGNELFIRVICHTLLSEV